VKETEKGKVENRRKEAKRRQGEAERSWEGGACPHLHQVMLRGGVGEPA
jgi:hypothetical protein